MHIKLIAPKTMYRFGVKSNYVSQNHTLMYLAALTPPEFNVEIVDENIKGTEFDKEVDIVGITFTSTGSNRAYEIADTYRRLGVTVVLGGFHTSIFPDEALKHANAIVIGEAEDIWQELLSDFRQGQLKPVYKRNAPPNLKGLPIPRFDLYDPENHFNTMPVQVTRGCPFRCSFCSIKTVYGQQYRKRPINDVINEIRHIKEHCVKPEATPPLSINFLDDNIWGDTRYAKELFRQLIPLDITWSTQVSVNIDDELADLSAKSGCTWVKIGLETLNEQNLKYLNKEQNKPHHYERCIKTLHDANIAVCAYVMFGLPYDDRNCFEDLTNFLENNFVELVFPSILEPTPGTAIFNDWSLKNKCLDYNTIEPYLPIFTYSDMTKEEFRYKVVEFFRRIYSDESIQRRFSKCNFPPLLYLNYEFQNMFKGPQIERWAEQIYKSECPET
jgi:radical SAM superfamily enzyme YgiQ (UPF0313 family)